MGRRSFVTRAAAAPPATERAARTFLFTFHLSLLECHTYEFENDTTLVIEHLADETFSTVTETSRYELKDGRFGNGGGGARWVATAMDDKSITFEPVANARNSFRWERESENTWKATLNWQSGDSVTSTRVYRMERWPPAGK